MSDLHFDQRKKDHLDLALRPDLQTADHSEFEKIQLIHEALPELSFKEVDISTSFLFSKAPTVTSSPLIISSMTAGSQHGQFLNEVLTFISSDRQILMGVGSQRKQLSSNEAAKELTQLRKKYPQALWIGNLGIAQVIQSSVAQVQDLVDSLEAKAFYVHLNSLQEVLQPEGTTEFAGSFDAIAKLAEKLSVPVIIKEVGCGFSEKTLRRLGQTQIWGVDVSGLGGTHWGRLEGHRAQAANDVIRQNAAQTYSDWGISTVQSLQNYHRACVSYQVAASGGVRTGLDAAKLISRGAQYVGVAQPLLMAASQGLASSVSDTAQFETAVAAVNSWMDQFEFELKTALFCTGSRNLIELQKNHEAFTKEI